MIFLLLLLNLPYFLCLPECKVLPVSSSSVHNLSEFEKICFRIEQFSIWDAIYIFSSVRLYIQSLDQPYVHSMYKLRENPLNNTATSFMYDFFESNKFSKLNEATFALNPYDFAVIVVENGYDDNRIKVETKFTPINYTHVCIFIVLNVVLYYSRNVVSSSIFYYIVGIMIGIFLSSLFLAYLLYILYSKTGFAAGIFTKLIYISIGLAFSIYLKHFWFLITTYPGIFSAYAGITSFISIATVYYFGPIQDPKIINILVTLLRILNVVAILLMSNHIVLTLSWVIVFLSLFYLRSVKIPKIFSRKKRRKVSNIKPRELITLEQYDKLGKSYTESALEELREQLGGEGSSVRLIANLHDPIRVLKFVSGGNHLSESELLEKSGHLNESFFTDDIEDLTRRPFYDSNG